METETFQPRRHVRTSCVMNVVLRTSHGPWNAVCRNVSRGGMFVTGALRPVGERLTVDFQVPAFGWITAEGEIRYFHRHPDGLGMGIAFTDIEPASLERLEHFIQLFAQPR